MKFFVMLSLAVYFWCTQAFASGYQANVNVGSEKPGPTETRSTATFVQTQFSTFNKLFRLHSGFTGLFGSGYMQGEGSLGLSLYLVSPFVSKNAPVHPFLTGAATVGIGALNQKSRLDTGMGYGAGVDLNFFTRSGLSISIQEHNAKEKCLRFALGFYWFNGSFE